MTKNRIPLLILSSLLFGLAACNPRTETPPAETPAAEAAVAAEELSSAPAPTLKEASLPVLDVAPTWSMPDIEGNLVSSAQFKGKVVVLDFWATWCPPCRAEIPGYIELQEKYGKDGLVIIGVSMDRGGPTVVQPFAEKFGINYPLVMGDNDTVAAFGGFNAIPTTFLIDREGNIRDVKTGSEETASYEKKILNVLN